MPVNTDIVVNHRRLVKKIDFNNESTAATFGITGLAFNSSGLTADLIFTNSITNNTAALSKVHWTANGGTFGYVMRWDPNTDSGATAMAVYGPNGEFLFEKMTIHNTATAPNGVFRITPTATVTGTVIVEFVL